MSRLDKPTLMCDRCRISTTDLQEMAAFSRLVHEHLSGHTPWDLCPDCWVGFRAFLDQEST